MENFHRLLAEPGKFASYFFADAQQADPLTNARLVAIIEVSSGLADFLIGVIHLGDLP